MAKTTMLYDISRCYPHHYVHHHKLTDKRRLVGFNQEGPAEIVWMVEEIDCLLQVKEATNEDNSNDGFTFAPPSIWENGEVQEEDDLFFTASHCVQ